MNDFHGAEGGTEWPKVRSQQKKKEKKKKQNRAVLKKAGREPIESKRRVWC